MTTSSKILEIKREGKKLAYIAKTAESKKGLLSKGLFIHHI